VSAVDNASTAYDASAVDNASTSYDTSTINASGYWLIEPEYMPGNETYSLCIPDCWRHVKTHMSYPGTRRSGEGDAAKPYPALIMLTTDGYFNSFLTNEGFVKAGADILKMLRDEGAEFVSENLESWLERSTNEGSGDDIAMALVYLVG
jgi:hypothetical protein